MHELFCTDIVVIGGGHAGIEAAHAAARAGVNATLITAHIDMIGQMSCNPAIGGIAKGTIAREVDALGGIMGRVIDRAGIHFHMLNMSKGAAVWGNRAQADKAMYRRVCRELLEERPRISLYQGMVARVISDDRGVAGVVLETGEMIRSKAVIVATGTFLNGRGHIGHVSFSCGRSGEPASVGLSQSIQKHGISAGRLKTGTPARLDGRTVDYARMSMQRGDQNPWPFSYSSATMPENKVCCWITKTTAQTHRIIQENIEQSALYGGKITGIGPRYCPSIEDKVVRFGERNGHTLFLEPEGLDNRELYCNGLSNSLPLDVQKAVVQSIPGLERAQIIRPAYAIEYDFYSPVQLQPTLESRIVPGLFFAGQVNGTSGYEEAACQGVIAGINAAAAIRGQTPLVLGRDQAYTGVLINDLVTKGADEPYRMFTSRAEYRLLLRQDNADERLMPIAHKRGLLDPDVYRARETLWEAKQTLIETLAQEKITVETKGARRKVVARDYCKRPEISIDTIIDTLDIACDNREIRLKAQSDIKYAGFIAKQKVEIERSRNMAQTAIPGDFDYSAVEGLLTESRQKLSKSMPATLGQAADIAGVTPADISVLILALSKRNVSRET
jgi:tRNA uridine 5-carboxymethylaminomethyl modification enzyme